MPHNFVSLSNRLPPPRGFGGRYFRSEQEAKDFSLQWKAPEGDESVPTTDGDMLRYASQIDAAMRDVSSVRKEGSGDKDAAAVEKFTVGHEKAILGWKTEVVAWNVVVSLTPV